MVGSGRGAHQKGKKLLTSRLLSRIEVDLLCNLVPLLLFALARGKIGVVHSITSAVESIFYKFLVF